MTHCFGFIIIFISRASFSATTLYDANFLKKKKKKKKSNFQFVPNRQTLVNIFLLYIYNHVLVFGIARPSSCGM